MATRTIPVSDAHVVVLRYQNETAFPPDPSNLVVAESVLEPVFATYGEALTQAVATVNTWGLNLRAPLNNAEVDTTGPATYPAVITRKESGTDLNWIVAVVAPVPDYTTAKAHADTIVF